MHIQWDIFVYIYLIQNKKDCTLKLHVNSIAFLLCECARTHLLATQDCKSSHEESKAEEVLNLWTTPLHCALSAPRTCSEARVVWGAWPKAKNY